MNTLTIAELIKHLSLLPPELNVVTRSGEYGYDDIDKVEIIKLTLNVNNESWEGKHDSYPDSKIDAVYIG
jgi:hypothetical protein